MFIILLKSIFKTKIISESKNLYLWVHESTILKSIYWFLNTNKTNQAQVILFYLYK